MAEDNTENSDEGFARIEPASISLTSKSSTHTAAKASTSLRQSPLLWLGLGVLFTAALVVIFLLPRMVGSPGEPGVAEAPVQEPAPTTSKTTPAKETVSPWEKAQESRLRKETQEILSQMLEAQKALAERGVELWAGDRYDSAMELAAAGDAYYNERDFVNSRVEYEKALAIFAELVEEMDVVFEATMKKGNQALVDGDSSIAKDAFQLALAIDALDRNANIGKDRAEKLDEVMALMKKADKLLEEDQLEQARQTYKDVQDIDEHFGLPAERIALTDSKILDRNFNGHMSEGFAALDKGSFSKARAEFNQALKLKPRAAEARAALEQTNHRLTTININSLLADARKLEAVEQWQQALDKYRAALALDKSLAEAQEGQQRTSLRSTLHNRLEQIISEPQRLYDAQVFDETLAFERKLKALSDPGPVLRKQLAALALLLRQADTPVTVNLQSDNLTQVTLRRVGELGLFLEKSISIKPGKYVLVGIRKGYRDVRIEFMVDPGKPMKTITVRAEEKIALGR